MSQQINSNILGNVVFYVDELEDDFTFYLDAASHAESIKEFKALLDAVAKDDDAKKKFSLSEQITFTNLIPSESSPKIDNALWSRLGSATDEPGRYLLGKLQGAATDPKEQAIVKCLANPAALSDETQRRLAQLLVKALSPTSLTDLTTQPWVEKLSLSQDQRDKLKVEDQRVLTRYLLEVAFPELKWQKPKGRALICLSHAGKYLSVTVRKQKGKVGYEPESLPIEKQKKRENYLFSVSEYCGSIYKPVFLETESTPNAQGLLVITGPTKSLKSEITRGLIHLYLKDKRKQGRRPHLVTFEDPIEMLYANLDHKGQLCVALARGKEPDDINYTPREKPRDAVFLRDALADALRQTPAVFFVGETRSKEEWEVLLDFAATGHLIVTTAHAGSLVEAMRKIFEARGVQTPADRGEIANKLLAVVNVKPDQIEIPGKSLHTDIVFPALWRRTTRGVAGLTSDGLSALIPHRNTPERPSCLGRRWFIEALIKLVQQQLNDAFEAVKKDVNNTQELLETVKKDVRNTQELLETVKKDAYKRAYNWDLQGV